MPVTQSLPFLHHPQSIHLGCELPSRCLTRQAPSSMEPSGFSQARLRGIQRRVYSNLGNFPLVIISSSLIRTTICHSSPMKTESSLEDLKQHREFRLCQVQLLQGVHLDFPPMNTQCGSFPFEDIVRTGCIPESSLEKSERASPVGTRKEHFSSQAPKGKEHFKKRGFSGTSLEACPCLSSPVNCPIPAPRPQVPSGALYLRTEILLSCSQAGGSGESTLNELSALDLFIFVETPSPTSVIAGAFITGSYSL